MFRKTFKKGEGKMICNKEQKSQNRTTGQMEQSQRIEPNIFT